MFFRSTVSGGSVGGCHPVWLSFLVKVHRVDAEGESGAIGGNGARQGCPQEESGATLHVVAEALPLAEAFFRQWSQLQGSYDYSPWCMDELFCI
jgi:hypothetical protein